ncbi:hypothetical protein VW29_07230 [Devosia limi DSM 17137]|uniref:BadF-type ATPase n=1 Tax=Devosia limi DSM 17137 TaxID=1121477 RepID=A0A0F5LS74_9HYPH|nr:BadF/BadG/BcrA/BcrD ATPase family protein [Devosia limi]KKB85131.1 hypothetical protein VW29_07230 [Devosia limi DSM 17137]SHF78235.1 BadF-type ATPase [Devosia limi DSM 17137]
MSYLGIDIGGTASRWALVDAKGKLLGRGVAVGATGHIFNPVERERLLKALQTIASALPHDGALSGVCLGLTGLGGGASEGVRQLVCDALGVAIDTVQASDDMELAFRAAFAPGTGHLISAGTGSIGLHIAADGSTIRVGGRGLLIDDGGSGTWIALQALDQLYRRIDETGGPADASVLAEELFAAMGGDDWDATRAFIYGSDRGRIGTLAQAVAKAATRGDALALNILERAAIELARLGLALCVRAGEHPIGFVGGIISLHPMIKTALTAALAGHDVVFPSIDVSLHAANLARSA